MILVGEIGAIGGWEGAEANQEKRDSPTRCPRWLGVAKPNQKNRPEWWLEL
jgi:hypothetical protein